MSCRGLSRWVLVVLLAVATGSIATAATPDEARIHAKVAAAQDVFEQGEALWKSGNRQGAILLFDRCQTMLLDAEQAAHGAYAERFFRIYKFYYDAREKYDGVTRIKKKAAAETSQAAFGDTPLSETQIQYQVDFMVSKRRKFLERSFQRALKYIPTIRREFEKKGVPPALAYLALVESGFRETPSSSAGARGLFQFMPATARRFGMQVDDQVDDRLDPLKSIRAAAEYLLVLHKQFDDWPLAVAAYNCGEGRVGRTLKKTGATTFWELADQEALPRETIDYVPRIVAVTLVARDPAKYGFKGFTPGESTTR